MTKEVKEFKGLLATTWGVHTHECLFSLSVGNIRTSFFVLETRTPRTMGIVRAVANWRYISYISCKIYDPHHLPPFQSFVDFTFPSFFQRRGDTNSLLDRWTGCGQACSIFAQSGECSEWGAVTSITQSCQTCNQCLMRRCALQSRGRMVQSNQHLMLVGALVSALVSSLTFWLNRDFVKHSKIKTPVTVTVTPVISIPFKIVKYLSSSLRHPPKFSCNSQHMLNAH